MAKTKVTQKRPKVPLTGSTTVKSSIHKARTSAQAVPLKTLYTVSKKFVSDDLFKKEISGTVKVKSKKKNKLSSPEVQLGLKLDKLIAERTSPSETPKKRKKMLKDWKKVSSSSSSDGLTESPESNVSSGPESTDADAASPPKLLGPLGVKRKSKLEPSQPDKISKQIAVNFSEDLDVDQLTDPVRAILQLAESCNKNLLFEGTCMPILMQLDMINPLIPKKKIIRFKLAHSLLTDSSDVCLIARDVYPDPAKTVEHFKEKIKSFGITCINEVIPLKMLNQDYGQYEDRRKLCDRFDYFLCDAAVAHRCQEKLGKHFYTKRKLPVPMIIDSKKVALNSLNALKKTTAIVKTGTTTVTFQIAHTSMKVNEVRDNIAAVWSSLDLMLPGGVSNVRQGALKTALSVSIPFYVSLKLPSEVNMASIDMLWKNKKTNKKPVPGEISTQPGAKVLVYPSGNIIVEGAVEKDKSINKSKNKIKKAEHKAKLRKLSKGDTAGSSKDNEEASSEDIDIKDVENQYLVEWSKSKGLKELVKEESKKETKKVKGKTKKEAVKENSESDSDEEDKQGSDNEEIEDEEEELVSDDESDED